MVPDGRRTEERAEVSRYVHDTVTVWAAHAPAEAELAGAVWFDYSAEEGEPESAFSMAFRTGWYDDDFAFYLCGDNLASLLADCSASWLTLDQQATSRIPSGQDWNALYVISGGAGDEWRGEEVRPPMPHGSVEVGGVTFRLLGTFPVISKF